MEFEIPVSMARELELMGVLSPDLPHDDITETFAERECRFRMPDLDENGEPPW
jgi:hypothetical protein